MDRTDSGIYSVKESNSASPTIIGMGFYGGESAVFKIFRDGKNRLWPNNDSSNVALDYEGRVYDYIYEQKDQEIKKYFVEPLRLFSKEFKLNTIRKMIEEGFIKNARDPILIERMREIHINYDTPIKYIVTKNIEGQVLLSSFSAERSGILNEYSNINYPDNNILEKELNNIFNLVITGIVKLNKELKIQHNDMHFRNLFIKRLPSYEPIHYDISNNPDGKTNTLDSKFQIAIYDFDRSFSSFIGVNELLNDGECSKGTGCNDYSNKDFFIFIIELLNVYNMFVRKANYSKLANYINDLIMALVPNKDNRDFLRSHLQLSDKDYRDPLGTFWSAYCVKMERGKLVSVNTNNPRVTCPSAHTFDSLCNFLADIPRNFEKYIKDTLKAKKNPIYDTKHVYYYNKYLKYKKKYLQLKTQV
jgi:hypothetical protein